ncbi:DUF72 domain-containing protein, partial [Streptomyces sp. Act-28]
PPGVLCEPAPPPPAPPPPPPPPRAAAPARGAPADPGLLDEVWRRFGAALEPLREADRMGAVLFQLPPWAAPGAGTRAFLEECRERTAGWRVAVEFRHPDWWARDERARTAALLGDLGLAAVAVDTARDLAGSLTPDVPVTHPALAVVRFHGRSPAWGTGTKEDRFRHDYTTAELREWVPRVCAFADRAAEVHVLFNNCCGDAAVRAAEAMRGVLDEEAAEEPPHTGAHGNGPAGQKGPHTIGPDRRDTPSASGTGTQEVSCRN